MTLSILLACSLFAAPQETAENAAFNALPEPPLAGLESCDNLILEGERHFNRLWRITSGGENAEGYWNSAGDQLSFQRRSEEWGVSCDQVYTWSRPDAPVMVSTGRGVTTCAYFLPGDRSIGFASTHGAVSSCPPPPDHSAGYVWSLWPEYDIWVRNLDTWELTQLTDTPGYDAELTVSPIGDRMVFTSTRSGDLELWTCDPDGSNLFQVTDTPGYDGGAFYSHDGKQLVFRTTQFTPGKEAEELASYRDLLTSDRVRPGSMEIYTIDVDGKNRKQVTSLGGANFAPYFYPDDKHIMFSSNHHEQRARNFDLFTVNPDGEELERITHYQGFDSFPMFSPDGKWLVFASNRWGDSPTETNLFLAEWR
ncbi:MAG: TolB protein [Planctomycetota bacterium]|jgi:TolB protein